MPHPSRRTFLAHSASCAGYLASMAAGLARSRANLWARTPIGDVVAQERFARLEKVADGIWAVVSTPLGGDRTTLCNGGIVQGRDGVLAIEAFMSRRGTGIWGGEARQP